MQDQKWNETYATGIEKIDDDHKKLIMLINKIYRLIVSMKYDHSDYVEVLDSLNSYITDHFAREEAWMLANGYPNMSEHIREHEQFIDKVAGLNKERLTIDTLSYLRVWLLTHIAVVDSDLGAFVREREVRGEVVTPPGQQQNPVTDLTAGISQPDMRLSA